MSVEDEADESDDDNGEDTKKLASPSSNKKVRARTMTDSMEAGTCTV